MFFAGFRFQIIDLITSDVPYSVNNGRQAQHEFALSRARSPARLPTNSGDFRASYLASGFGVTRLLATLYLLMSQPSLSYYKERDLARLVIYFRPSGSSMESVIR